MSMEEADPFAASRAEADRILREAGWRPLVEWAGRNGRQFNEARAFAVGNLVGGFAPDGSCHIKDWTRIPPGHPDHSANTPDTPHEAAQWLADLTKPEPNPLSLGPLIAVECGGEAPPVYVAPEPQMPPDINIQFNPTITVHGANATSGDSEAGATQSAAEREAIAGVEKPFDEAPEQEEISADVPAETHFAEPLGADVEEAAGGDQSGDSVQEDVSGGPEEAGGMARGEGALDADFTEFGEPEPEADLEALADATQYPHRGIAWEGDLGEDIIASEHEPATTQFFMGDNLDRMRSQRIGDVVQISIAKQEAIWAASGATENEYRDLRGQVMHDTVNGLYTGPQGVFDRFTELQGYMNSAAHVQDTERGFVAFLKDATREEIEAFDPEANWP